MIRSERWYRGALRISAVLLWAIVPLACAPALPVVAESPAPRREPLPRPPIEVATGEGTRVEVEAPPPDLRRRPLATLTGTASYYSDRLHNRITASGIPYDRNAYVAAHRSYPFGTVLRVTNLVNDRVVTVRVVDRGPFIRGRVLDLSRRAAEELGFIEAGLTEVRIEVIEYGAS